MAALVASQEMVSAYDALIRDCLKTAAWKSDNEFVTTLATLIVGYKRLLGSVEETQIPPELRRFFDTPGAISDAVKAAYEASQQKKKGE